ncbi:F-box and associated interaction domains-containing protein [Prunus dulcis]|uniref:F-box and associated interaction domains-containing protein n=1 Tax=Prunus dulcis TaxID=3755 RepID=A0A4Y1QN24_PRUDU|nr:F-box and associated interaction domains-containing protein [Prunus dulcis]
MARETKGNPMNPRKKVATRAAMSSKNKEQSGEQCQPKAPCSKFQQLPQALVLEILSSLSIKTLLNCSNGTNEYKLLQMTNGTEAEIYTIGTGVWRSVGNAPGDIDQLPFNPFLHGALHWVSYSSTVPDFIHSFDFEREQFRPLPVPSLLGNRFSDCYILEVVGERLCLSVFDDDYSKFDMWVMEEYETKSFREIRITWTRSPFEAIAYSPSFVSLYNVSKGEEVKRVRRSKKSGKKSGKLLLEGSYECAGSGMPPRKSTKLNSGYGCPVFEEAGFNSEDEDCIHSMRWPLGLCCKRLRFPMCQQWFESFDDTGSY